MKVHKMSNKQFAKFVICMQEQAEKNPLGMAVRITDKYDYICRKDYYFLCDADWIIKRRLGGKEFHKVWAVHNYGRKAWTVYEGDKVYEYLDSELEKAVQNG